MSYFEIVGYGAMAENAANSLVKGSRVIVSGRLEQRTWETENGDKRSIVEINADEIAPSLRYATAVVTKTPRAEGAAPAPARSATSAPRPAPAAASSDSVFDEEPF